MDKKDNINPKHYTDLKISPVVYIDENNIGYVEGNIIKYVSRYKAKNGLEDLEKAKWYLNYLISKNENR